MLDTSTTELKLLAILLILSVEHQTSLMDLVSAVTPATVLMLASALYLSETPIARLSTLLRLLASNAHKDFIVVLKEIASKSVLCAALQIKSTELA